MNRYVAESYSEVAAIKEYLQSIGVQRYQYRETYWYFEVEQDITESKLARTIFQFLMKLD